MTDYYDPDEQTFRCRECLDGAFVWTTPPTLPSVLRPHRRLPNPHGQPILRACENCVAGIAIESGDWAKALREDRRHKPDPADIAAFRERQRSHPRGNDLRERVERLLGEKREES